MTRWVLLALAVTLALAGCGRRTRQSSELTLEELGDTTGISHGTQLLAGIEPYRMPNGVVRIHGMLDVPDGTRLQVSIFRHGSRDMLGRWQMTVLERHFDSPPMLGPQGPLPPADYRIEYFTLFNHAWQPQSVLDATDQGRRLHGPGMSRDQTGQGVFFLVEERRL